MLFWLFLGLIVCKPIEEGFIHVEDDPDWEKLCQRAAFGDQLEDSASTEEDLMESWVLLSNELPELVDVSPLEAAKQLKFILSVMLPRLNKEFSKAKKSKNPYWILYYQQQLNHYHHEVTALYQRCP